MYSRNFCQEAARVLRVESASCGCGSNPGVVSTCIYPKQALVGGSPPPRASGDLLPDKASFAIRDGCPSDIASTFS